MATQDAEQRPSLDAWIVDLFERAAQTGFREYPPIEDGACLDGWRQLDSTSANRLVEAGWNGQVLARLSGLFPQLAPVEWTVIFLMCSLNRFGTLDPDL